MKERFALTLCIKKARDVCISGFLCIGTSGRTRTDTAVKPGDFDVNLSLFSVARLYHHPKLHYKLGAGRCFTQLLLLSYFLCLNRIAAVQVVVEPSHSVRLAAD